MSRPQRNRRLSRRMWSPEHSLHSLNRPTKRLFTPEIKRMLKDWLVRRRDNPYPSRDEKKCLAMDTGLTYTQICNWFANWRRKLKNSELHVLEKNSWGSLIKNYNTNARGNVEQFSISSEDSIWEEDVDDHTSIEDDFRESQYLYKNSQLTNSYFGQHYEPHRNHDNRNNYYCYENNGDVKKQCFQTTSASISESINESQDLNNNKQTTAVNVRVESLNKTKYKQKMMEKYLRDQKTEEAELNVVSPPDLPGTTELSKWLESAAKFIPNKNNYCIEWNARSKLSRQENRKTISNDYLQPSGLQNYTNMHHRDELEAAEALANLAFNCRQRMLDSNPGIHKTVNAISS